jgi:glycosyltransferase involved in cell wall biosynthesis
MLGSGWHADQLNRHLLDHYVDRNFDITVLIHDLTPVVFPDVTGTVLQEVFETWLHSVLRLKADILCYSQNTQRDVLRFCVSQGIPAPRTHVIPLVHELKRLEPGPIRDEIAQLAKQDYVLFVGPLSGRKNGLLLMRFWQRLADELGSKNIPRLVFAGASGPQDVPESHRDALTPNITFITKPNDDELAALYQHSAFSVFLSMYEGWGLPVGESLWHGKTCLVADNSSLREVGGPFCKYVDLDDSEAVYAKLKQMVSNKSYIAALNSQIDRSKLRTWNDVARELSHLCEGRNTTKPGKPILTLETKSQKAKSSSTHSNVSSI